MASKEAASKDLDVLRATLTKAEHALATLAEDAPAEARKAAEDAKADAEKALGEAKLEAANAERAVPKLETRVTHVDKEVVQEVKKDAEEVEVEAKNAWEDLDRVQNKTRTIDAKDLTPEEQAARRNPEHT